MAYPNYNFYSQNGPFNPPLPPSSPSFNEHIQPTPYLVPPYPIWCHQCQNPSHSSEQCPQLGSSLGLGQNQIDISLRRLMSEPYTCNTGCWNNSNFSMDQSYQNSQFNWSNLNPPPPPSETNNEDIISSFKRAVDALEQSMAQPQTFLEDHNSLTSLPQSSRDSQLNWSSNDPSIPSLGFPSESFEEAWHKSENQLQASLQEQQISLQQCMAQLQTINQMFDCVDEHIIKPTNAEEKCEKFIDQFALAPLNPSSLQTQEHHHANQVNPISKPQDSTPILDTPSESVTTLCHLNNIEEVEFYGDDDWIPYATLLKQIDQNLKEVCMDDEPWCLDELFQEDLVTHAISIEHIDNKFENACVDNELLLLDEQFDDEFENFGAMECVEENKHVVDDEFLLFDKKFEHEFEKYCEEQFVEKHEFPSKHVEEIMRAPFGRKPLDLSIFTFDELNDEISDNNVNDNNCWENIEVEKKIVEKYVQRNFWGDVETLVIEDIFIEDVWMKVHKKKLRRRRNKLERMRIKLTKRLSSSLCPLKRTHWNDGKRARGKRPRRG